MARRGGALSDSDSDLSEDDDVSDVEDEALRRRVREAATGVRRDARLDHRRFEDRARGSAPTRAPAASAGEASATAATAGPAARNAADGRQVPSDPARDDRVDDEEREVLCAAVSDASAPPRHVPGINSGQIGPELAKLRSAQGEHAEYYTLEHYDRLYGRRRAWARDGRGSKVWCKDVHGPGCRECTSCHFCRQKTADVKTRCQCGEWRSTPPGGRGRGAWCGWCLEMRMGENIEEALADEEWRCPVCRDICNCSGANCLRAKRNLFPTQQLTHEALQFGWQSVAHYLITTRIRENAEGPMPMLQLPRAQREQFQRRRAQIGGSGGGGLEARARRAAREKEDARRRRAAALRDAVARRLGEALTRQGARAPAERAGADADTGGEVFARRDGAFRTFGGDSDDASSGSDLDSDDDDDDDEGAAARETPNGGGGEGNAGFADRDGRGDGPGVGRPREAPGGPEIVVVDDDDDAPRRTGIRSADFAPRAIRPRDDDVVPDSQSDEDDADGRGTRSGFGGGGGGGGGGDRDRDRDLRRAKRPRVRSAVGPASAAAAAAPMEDRPLRDGSEATADRAPPAEPLAAETRTAGRRLRRRRAAKESRRADRDAAREASVLEHELASETRAAASENEAARALREASSSFTRSSLGDEDEDEDTAYRFSSRLVDRAADALDAAEASASARAARADIQSASRRAEGSHVGDLSMNASSDDALSALRESAARADQEADETLASMCALATLLSRRACSSSQGRFSRGNARAARRALERLVHGDAGSDDTSGGFVPRNDAAAFRARSGVRRAVTLRAVLRSLEHARAASAHIAAANLIAVSPAVSPPGALSAASNDAKEFVAATASVATSLLAVLGEEFCLLREHARWRARRQGGEGESASHEPFRENVAPPPPLPPALAAFVGEDGGQSRRSEGNATAATADASVAGTLPDVAQPSSSDEPLSHAMDAAERLLTRMEECHVLLTFALRLLRRVASASTVRVSSNDVVAGYGQTGTAPRPQDNEYRDVVLLAPGSDALVSETLAAFLQPRYPFRARLRRRALAVVASHATATRRCASLFSDADANAPGSRVATEALHASATALERAVWPALASLLESDHPARRDATTTNANANDSLPFVPRDASSSGCGRFVIEATARVIGCLLASKVWSWGRAEREIVKPHTNASDFWRRASAPYRALALRLYSRLCDVDASPVLSAGAGAPLLKLWVLATLDPAAAEGGTERNGAGGFGRARARLARAVRRHPSLGAKFFVDEDALVHGDAECDAFGVASPSRAVPQKKYSLYSPAPVPLETRGKWVRHVLARLCSTRDVSAVVDRTEPAAASLAALAAANSLWDAAPARHAEVFGTTAADKFADAVADVSAAAIAVFAAKLHLTHPGSETKSFHVAGAHVCVASRSHGPRSRNASRLTAMVHVIAARHASATAAASSARSVASSALAAAAYAGSGRAEAAAKTAERLERLVAESTLRVRDATIGLRALFARGRAGHDDKGPQDDPPLVGAVVALTHALWERGPPRAPTEEARDAAADAFFDDAFASLSRGGSGLNGLDDDDDGSASLASFAHSAIFRGALLRCVPNRVLLDDASRASHASHTRGGGAGGGFFMNGATHGGHMYPPGAVAAALGTIKTAARLLTRAEINGSLPETVFGSFCVFASALLDATFPPPPPPDPRRSAPPSGAQAAPPAVRRAAYAYFAELAARAPGACGETDREDLSRDFGKREHLRAFWQAPPLNVVEGAVRASLRAAVTFAACEVAAASGFAGAREAATQANGSVQTNASGAHEASLETSFENKDAAEGLAGVPPTRFESVESSVDKMARSARATARGALRGLLGAHPNSGAYDEVLRRFKPSSVSANDAFSFGSHNASSHTKDHTTGSRVGDGAVARDVPAGKDFDAADAALEFLRDYASVSSDAAAHVAKRAFPLLTGALSEHGAGNLRRYTRVNALALWEVVNERLRDRSDVVVPAAPPTPPEANLQNVSGKTNGQTNVTVVRSSRDALNHRNHVNARTGGLNGNVPFRGGGRTNSESSTTLKSPWPSSASSPLAFGDVKVLCQKAHAGDAAAKKTKLSVIGAVVSRDPSSGVKSLTNPKSGKAYDMLFLTLADHTGARCKAQLLGARAKAAAAALDASLGSLGGAHAVARVVVGLCDVSPRGGDAAAVWDPKEESVFVLRPEHPAASRL